MTHFIDTISASPVGKKLLQSVKRYRQAHAQKIVTTLSQKPDSRSAYDSLPEEEKENLNCLTTGLTVSDRLSSSADWSYMHIVLGMQSSYFVPKGDIEAHAGEIMHELTHIKEAYVRICSLDVGNEFNRLNELSLEQAPPKKNHNGNYRIACLPRWEYLWMQGLRQKDPKELYLGEHKVTITGDVHDVPKITHFDGVPVNLCEWLKMDIVETCTQPNHGFIRPYSSIWRGQAYNLGTSFGVKNSRHSFFQEDIPTIVEMFYRNRRRFFEILGTSMRIGDAQQDIPSCQSVIQKKVGLLVDYGFLPKEVFTTLQ